MTPEQTKWLEDNKVRSTDVKEDSIGKYVDVTNSFTGEVTKKYI